MLALSNLDLAKLVFACTEREEKAIILRSQGLLLKTIGEKLGVSAKRASNMIQQGIEKMRSISDKEVIDAYNLGIYEVPLMRVKELDNCRNRVVRNVFWTRGFRTLKSITKLSYNELLAKPYQIPINSLNIMVDILASYGLTLKDWQEHQKVVLKVHDLTNEFKGWWNIAKEKAGPQVKLLRRLIRSALNE